MSLNVQIYWDGFKNYYNLIFLRLMLQMHFDCQKIHAGLSLKGGGQGFPLATKNVSPSYFHREIEEK